MSATTWDEYRAIVRRPASLLDSADAQELGWVAEAGPIRRSAQDAAEAASKGSDETHASVMGMEWRTVSAEPWEEIEL